MFYLPLKRFFFSILTKHFTSLKFLVILNVKKATPFAVLVSLC